MKRIVLFILSGVILFSGCRDEQAIIFEVPESITNEVNSDPESITEESTDVIIVPDAPRDFTATAGDRQVELTWLAPNSDGGENISGYEVSSNGGGVYISASSNNGHIFIDLENDTTYDFRVRAVNEMGVGEFASVSAIPSGVIIPETVGETFTDSTGFEWRVLTVEDNKALIITEHVHNMGVSYHDQDGYLPFQNAEIANVLNTWFDNDSFVSPGIRAKALPYAFQLDDGTPGGNGVENQATEWIHTPSSTNQQQAITIPGEQGSGDIAFILSISEVHKYFEDNIYERIAYRISETGEVGETAYWWSRSPSTHSEYVVWIVGYNGFFYYDPALYTSPHLGIRPAFWVNL
ncbi:MAG: fibronectin type III domain-containing protein [Oscillospiraceae bacterium]|nr:fibronectin type III domain-containing protein [Oscillospiraceae bacterium]